MSHLCAQIRGLYCKAESSLFWEERNHSTKMLQENWFKKRKLRAFKDSDCTFSARVGKTAGAERVEDPKH